MNRKLRTLFRLRVAVLSLFSAKCGSTAHTIYSLSELATVTFDSLPPPDFEFLPLSRREELTRCLAEHPAEQDATKRCPKQLRNVFGVRK